MELVIEDQIASSVPETPFSEIVHFIKKKKLKTNEKKTNKENVFLTFLDRLLFCVKIDLFFLLSMSLYIPCVNSVL